MNSTNKNANYQISTDTPIHIAIMICNGQQDVRCVDRVDNNTSHFYGNQTAKIQPG